MNVYELRARYVRESGFTEHNEDDGHSADQFARGPASLLEKLKILGKMDIITTPRN
jgi:hypothetical protein